MRHLLNDAPHLRILIVPNPRDLIYDHVVFPQRSYGSFGLEVGRPLIAVAKSDIAAFSEPSPYPIHAHSFSTTCDSLHARSTYCAIYGKQSFKRRQSSRLETQRAWRAQGIPSRTLFGRYWISGGMHTITPGPNLVDCRQSSFYPLFPTPKAYSADVNLDVSHSELLRLEEAPDVLVLPSVLGKFHKVSLAVKRKWMKCSNETHRSLIARRV